MTIFTVIVTRETTPGALKDHLTAKFLGNHLAVTGDCWLVSGKGPAQAMSDLLGMTDGSVAVGIVSAMGSYYGRASTNIWEWIKVKKEEASLDE